MGRILSRQPDNRLWGCTCMPTRDLSVKRIQSPGLKQLSSVISLMHTDALPQGQPADLLPLPADHLHLPPQLSHVGAGFRTRQEHVWKRPAFDTG